MPNLIQNGNFSNGMTNWYTSRQITHQITGGVFEFYRNAGGGSASLHQVIGVALVANMPVEIHVDIGNSSSVRKRVTIIAHDNDGSDQ